MSLRRTAALLTGFGLALGLLGLTAAPAQARSYGVSANVADASVVVGAKVTITGTVSPKPSSRYVYLQQRSSTSKTWTTVKKVRTSASGRYTATTTPGNTTDRYYRIYKPKQGSRKADYSRPVLVIVDPVMTSGSSAFAGLAPESGPLSGGTIATITGSGLTGTTSVTFTPQVAASDTADGTGILPEVAATAVTVVDDNTLQVTTPASLGGANLVKIYAPGATLTTTFTYAATSRAPSVFEQQVLDEINARRAVSRTCHDNGTDHQLPATGPVTWDGKLGDLASEHSNDLAARQDVYAGIAHVTYGTRDFTTRFARAGVTGAFGEILEVSPQSDSASTVVDNWINSTTGHCGNLMRAGWTRAGVGVTSGTWQNVNAFFSNVDFQ